MATVVVGMSGGVDSSLSALLLKEQGYRVIGLFMKNWEETDPETGVCSSAEDFHYVERVCKTLDIPYYSIRFVEEYRDLVFRQFLEDYQKGLTPNPDVLCNREIKFELFLQKALQLGADFLATGHYCQRDAKGQLLRGKDPNKDQSYFLHAVSHQALIKTLFPIGHLYKSQVRIEARKHGLASADKKDSTGICFIGKKDFKPFLSQYLTPHRGLLQKLDGTIVGEHDGVAFYTIGQRKGLGLGGAGEAWYVVGKDREKNIVFVEQGENHPALFSRELKAQQLTWVWESPRLYPFRCTAKIRYRQLDAPCLLQEDGSVLFDHPQRAITPGQSIVFYQDEVCLGGGRIAAIGSK